MNPNKIKNPDEFPTISFGSWAGGDRDGHPFVNPAVTKETLLLHRQAALSLIREEADNVLDCYRVVRQHVNQYGIDGNGSFIVSMTRNLSDLLVVYFLMQEPRLLNTNIRVVPLLETIQDLQNGPEILDQFLKHPITQSRSGRIAHKQEVMLGYSDI